MEQMQHNSVEQVDQLYMDALQTYQLQDNPLETDAHQPILPSSTLNQTQMTIYPGLQYLQPNPSEFTPTSSCTTILLDAPPSQLHSSISHYKQGNYTLTITLLQLQLHKYLQKQFKTLTPLDQHQLIRIRFFLGNSYFILKNIDKAIQCYNHHYEENIQAPERRGQRLHNLACCYAIIKKYSLAFEKFNLALKIYYKLNKSTIVILFNNVGRLYECHDMNIEATEYYIRALITAEQYMKDNNSVQYRAKIVHSFLNSLSKLSGKQLSKSYTNNIPKLALYIDPNNTNIIVKIRLQIQVLLVRINIQLYDLTRALQHLEIVNSMFDEQKDKMDDLELIKANVIYEGAAAFYAMEDIKQAEILLKAAKKYYQGYAKCLAIQGIE